MEDLFESTRITGLTLDSEKVYLGSSDHHLYALGLP